MSNKGLPRMNLWFTTSEILGIIPSDEFTEKVLQKNDLPLAYSKDEFLKAKKTYEEINVIFNLE